MKFIDEAIIEVIGGNGGNGVASFRREKFIPKGGPNGGDGGRGGNVIVIADINTSTLLDFKYKRSYVAPNGQHGKGSDKYGAFGKDIILKLPVGTIITDIDTNEIMCDLTYHNQKFIIAYGGLGGLGNIHFKSSTNRAPRQFTLGKIGERRKIKLELRLIADIGLLGLPNAGKSTFIHCISNSRPKVADYPFTTINPHLAVLNQNDYFSNKIVIADIPGLIKGASEGAGLGLIFLRHLLRTKLLLHFIDISSHKHLNMDDFIKNIIIDVKNIETELSIYNKDLIKKPRWIIFNKLDIFDFQDKLQDLRGLFLKELRPIEKIFFISGKLGVGIPDLISEIKKYIKK
ncbi:GTPase Obg [Candidatus Kinetoplastibacterium sorsogonicusi]|uniref:GTPase Obg n=1 Tax=Candidatus Kinetoplastidibacterium kentomonadis TaxID=1576550 RepID=A0A3Q8ETZ8_9PROT|nr:GTPase ObgE [Candidatus Kinetoplastibacterium sorsogonicusi]AWD32707.1 GTPase Obg [Candidatus Kinetoplastibacterium sorsogonicusi]